MSLLRRFVFILICVLSNSFGYDIKCPDSSQWKPRAIQKCLHRPNTLYLCLWNLIDSKYKEHCGQKELSRLGYKYVLMPNPQPVPCSNTFFQPFKFTSDGNSRCVFPKSECSEEGQVVANDGTSITDRSCRCDYTRGYAFVTTPRNKCTCIPSLEDCSCYYKQCSDQHEILMRDYTCMNIKEDILPENILCEDFFTSSSTLGKTNETQTIATMERFDNHNRGYSSVSLFIILCVLVYAVMFVCIAAFIYVQPSVECLAIKSSIQFKPGGCDNKHTVLAGDTISITMEIYTSCRFTIKSAKIFGPQGELTNVIRNSEDNTITLILENVTSSKSGTYYCIVENSIGIRNTTLSTIRNWFGDTSKRKNCVTVDVFSCEDNEHSKVAVFGDDVKLETAANIQHHSPKMVTWLKMDTHKYFVVPVENTNKYSGGTKLQSSLTINKCNYSDAGQYICIMTDGEDNIIKSCSCKTSLILKDLEKGQDAVSEHSKDQTFVRTSVVEEILCNFQTYNFIIITGRKGTGKSKVCLEIASEYTKMNFTICEKDNVKHMVMDINDRQTLFIINVDVLKESDSDSLKNLIKQSSPNQKFLLACRYDFLEKRLQKEKVFYRNLDFCLSIEEKRKILKNHIKSNNIVQASLVDLNDQTDPLLKALDEDTIELIVQAEPWNGFPYCASFFCSDIALLKQGESYFLDPPKNVIRDIQAIYFNAANGEKDVEKRHKFCVLVYIVQSEETQLSFRDFDEQLYYFIWSNIFHKKYDVKEKCHNDCIVEAANSMIHSYLIYNQGVYKLFSRCVIPAVVMAAPHNLLKVFISEASLNDVIDYVNKDMFTSTFDFFDGHYHTVLFKRLEKELLKDSSEINRIGKYIYKKWLKEQDNIIKSIILTYTGRIVSTGEKEHNALSVWNLISLLEEITFNGKDPWIYTDKISDGIVILGLIAAAKGNYFAERKEAFGILFSQFKNKLNEKGKTFIKIMNSELDSRGKTFLDYIVSFGVTEAVIIIDAVFSKKYKELNSKFDESYIKTLRIAASLGKLFVFKIFLVKTKYVKTNKDRLLLDTQAGIEEHSVQETNRRSFEFYKKDCDKITTIFEIFEKDVLRCLCWGSKEDFLAIVMLLKTRKLKDVKVTVRETLRSAFVPQNVFLDL